MLIDTPELAPELDTVRWFNSPPLTLAALRGRIVVIEAFQMLCPGCVNYGLPQAQRLNESFDPADVTVIGLHTVFEHHDAMRPEALEVFLAEYRIAFPVAVDRHAPGETTPATMGRYGLRGTPSTLVIDRSGRLQLHAFGALDDLALGTTLGRLLAAPPGGQIAQTPGGGTVCSPDGASCGPADAHHRQR